jgi:hypothetical protein
VVGDELRLIKMISTTTTTMKATATTSTHRAPDRERLAGPTDVKLPRGWACAGPLHQRRWRTWGSAAPPIIGCCALIAAPLDHDVRAASAGGYFVDNDRTSDRGAFVEHSGRNQRQPLATAPAANPLSSLRTVANACHRLRPPLHGKERVNSSSLLEGSAKAPLSGAFLFGCTCMVLSHETEPTSSAARLCVRTRFDLEPGELDSRLVALTAVGL